jgi:hypothetical protein
MVVLTHSLRKDDRSLPSEGSKEAAARRYKTRLRLYEISRVDPFHLTHKPIFSILGGEKSKCLITELPVFVATFVVG